MRGGDKISAPFFFLVFYLGPNPCGGGCESLHSKFITNSERRLLRLCAMNIKNLPLVLGVVWISLLNPKTSAWAQAWQPTGAPGANWAAIVSSTNGNNLVAAVYQGGVYSSTNSGNSWVLTAAPSLPWQSVAGSADGLKLIAAADSGQIYTSTDGGNVWISNNVPTQYWVSVASSANGSNLVALCDSTNLIYHSTDAGVTWSAVVAEPVSHWRSVASSADGMKLVAAVFLGGIYVSTNSGTSWNLTAAPMTNWTSVASSADGLKLVATHANDGEIYVSTNSGGTWNLTSAPGNVWFSVASSADGTKLAAAAGGPFGFGYVYGSSDSGLTWTESTAPGAAWYSIASSANGNKLVAAIYGGLIYSWQYTPILNIANLQTNVAVSWIAGASDFALLQNHDLSATGWTAVTNTPLFTATNSLNAVTLPLSDVNSFFRLKAQ